MLEGALKSDPRQGVHNLQIIPVQISFLGSYINHINDSPFAKNIYFDTIIIYGNENF